METHLQSSDNGRETPLPQYEKTQSVPFTLNLQEDRSNPGRFQLVVNIEPNHRLPTGISRKPVAFTRAPTIAGESDKNNPSILHHARKPSPPTSPLQDKQGWSDLNTVPPEFLQKVVPDWNVTFSRSDSTASAQSKTLADIKARIKRKGKGYVVRLLKGSSLEPHDVAEVDLGQGTAEETETPLELDSCSPRAELYSPPTVNTSTSDSVIGKADVFEIGTSNEPGIQASPSASARATVCSDSQPSYQTLATHLSRRSIVDDSLSDAETLIPDIRSISGRMDGDETDYEPLSGSNSVLPLRTNSVLSIVKTPTRGLSVVGPVRRVEKSNRTRVKGKAGQQDLRRSDAHKSIKHRSPQGSIVNSSTSKPLQNTQTPLTGLRQRIVSRKTDQDGLAPLENNTWQHTRRESGEKKSSHVRRSSAEDVSVLSKPKTKLRLQTNIARPMSANTSPVTRRKKASRPHKPSSSSSSSSASSPGTGERMRFPANWSEVDGSDELREVLQKVFKAVPGSDGDESLQEKSERSVPRTAELDDELNVGDILLPPDLEIRSAPVNTKSPMSMFWSLAFSALTEKVYEGFKTLQDNYGAEPCVPPGHVRVRWTCVSMPPVHVESSLCLTQFTVMWRSVV